MILTGSVLPLPLLSRMVNRLSAVSFVSCRITTAKSTSFSDVRLAEDELGRVVSLIEQSGFVVKYLL